MEACPHQLTEPTALADRAPLQRREQPASAHPVSASRRERREAAHQRARACWLSRAVRGRARWSSWSTGAERTPSRLWIVFWESRNLGACYQGIVSRGMRATSRSTASASLTDGRSPASSQQRLRRLRQHPALREQRRRRVHVSAHDEASTAFESVYDALGVQVSEPSRRGGRQLVLLHVALAVCVVPLATHHELQASHKPTLSDAHPTCRAADARRGDPGPSARLPRAVHHGGGSARRCLAHASHSTSRRRLLPCAALPALPAFHP